MRLCNQGLRVNFEEFHSFPAHLLQYVELSSCNRLHLLHVFPVFALRSFHIFAATPPISAPARATPPPRTSGAAIMPPPTTDPMAAMPDVNAAPPAAVADPTCRATGTAAAAPTRKPDAAPAALPLAIVSTSSMRLLSPVAAGEAALLAADAAAAADAAEARDWVVEMEKYKCKCPVVMCLQHHSPKLSFKKKLLTAADAARTADCASYAWRAAAASAAAAAASFEKEILF